MTKSKITRRAKPQPPAALDNSVAPAKNVPDAFSIVGAPLPQTALEESRDRHVDLYELAPVGYPMLNHTGLTTEINLAGAALLGKELQRLARRRFARCAAAADNERWHRLFFGTLQHDDRRLAKCHCSAAMAAAFKSGWTAWDWSGRASPRRFASC